MKAVFSALLFAAYPADAAQLKLSPITRVVELLQGLAKQAAKDGKKEEDLYETFVCWAKTVIDTKTASNAAASSKIEELETYIADLDSGRIELTTERQDLEKEIKQLFQEMEEMKSTRDQEHEDYEAAKEEMEDAIAGLTEAVETLSASTGQDTKFLQVDAAAREGYAARAAENAKLQVALSMSEKFLERGDALFLRRVLTGEVPKADWKKLNRKNPLKHAYKARSTKITDVLQKMLDTFKTNLADATTKEEESLANYNELYQAKSDQKAEASDALNNMDGENGAKAESKADAEEELNALKTQVENDERYIEQTANDLETKKAEWKDRQELRTGEIAAINKAIAILHSDDARDLFKKSFSSQGFFLQLETSTAKGRSSRAAEVLRRAAVRSTDKKLAALASRLAAEPMATGTHFDEVIQAIDAMISVMEEQEAKDLEDKENCEKDRAEDTRSAVVAGRTMDENSAEITKLKNDIVEIEKTIADNNAEIKSVNEELEKATTLRGEEHAAWVQSNEEDNAAKALVEQAKNVLADFYEDNNLVGLVQTNARMEPSAAGEAPPPPPKTWDEPYGGKTEQSEGIVAILEMIYEDIEKDITKAKAEEDKAEAAFQTFKTDSETQVTNLEETNDDLEGTKGDKQDAIGTAKQDRLARKDEMNVAIQKIHDATAGCDYITLNYAVRLANRQAEMDGLKKAKAILQGGEFSN